MYRKVLTGKEAREKLIKGVNTVVDAVKTSLGPRGRLTAIGGRIGAPKMTKDGFTIAKHVNLVDVEEDMGCQMAKQAAFTTVIQAGDGTTTAMVLTQAIIKHGVEYVEAGANPVDLLKGINEAVEHVVKFIKENSKDVRNDSAEIESIATISANNDPEIGKLIAEAMAKVGPDGQIQARESSDLKTTVEVVEGMQLSNGFAHPMFITDEQRLTAVIEDAYVFLYDKKIREVKDIIPVADAAITRGKGLVIISEGVEGEALKSLVANKKQHGFRVVVINMNEIGTHKINVLKDIASVVNGKVLSPDEGVLISRLEEDGIMEYLGHIEKITVTRDSAIIINEKAARLSKCDRIELLKSQIEGEKNEEAVATLKNRLAKISGGIGMITVGGANEMDMQERKDRIDDALEATKAAVEEGVVPGGGKMYLSAIAVLSELTTSPHDKGKGYNIVKMALRAPFDMILSNAGLEPNDYIAQVIKGSINYGFNSKTEQYENFYETGIVDPAKVSRVALENAAAVAGSILMTECVLSLETEK